VMSLQYYYRRFMKQYWVAYDNAMSGNGGGSPFRGVGLCWDAVASRATDHC
jgi:hypothetical protein